MGDASIEPTEILTPRDWLGFAGIAPVACIAISKEQQFAEKLHAYTLPREETVNSRVKDLVDMTLLSRLEIDWEKVAVAVETTFSVRNTHDIPERLPDPPSFWEDRFKALAQECRLDLSLDEAFQLVSQHVSAITTPENKDPTGRVLSSEEFLSQLRQASDDQPGDSPSHGRGIKY